MFFGLNFRQCAFSVLAILCAIGIYFGLKGIVPDSMRGWMCMVGASPFAACGFFKYHGMNAEQFAWAFIKSEILYPRKLSFRPESLYYSCLEEKIFEGEKGRTKAKKQKRGKKHSQKRSRRTSGRSVQDAGRRKGNSRSSQSRRGRDAID